MSSDNNTNRELAKAAKQIGGDGALHLEANAKVQNIKNDDREARKAEIRSILMGDRT